MFHKVTYVGYVLVNIKSKIEDKFMYEYPLAISGMIITIYGIGCIIDASINI